MGINKDILKVCFLGDIPAEIEDLVTHSIRSFEKLSPGKYDVIIVSEDYPIPEQEKLPTFFDSENFYIYCKPENIKQFRPLDTISTPNGLKTLVRQTARIKQLLNSNSRLNKKYNLLTTITSTSNNISEPELLMSNFMDKLQLFLETDAWSLLFLNKDKTKLNFALTNEEICQCLKNLELPANKGIAGKVVQTQETVVVNDVSSDHLFYSKIDDITGFKSKNILAAPLIVNAELFGVIELINKKSREPFNQEDIDTVNIIVKYGSIILKNAMLFKEMEEMTKRDELTGLYNARYLNQFLEEQTRQAIKNQSHISALFIDLDNFKMINDTYGHIAGSSALIDIAKIIKKSVREEDFIARYGGDEFIIIQTGLDSTLAAEYADTVLKNISSYHYREIEITASIGLATFPEHGKTPEEIISKADKAMYIKKTHGKNGVEIAPEKQYT